MSVNQLQCFKESSKHHLKAFDYFDFNQLDAFHNQDIMSVIFGNNWHSVLIIEKDKAFLHAFCKQAIGNTGWYDIEPFIGYGGAIVNTSDRSFISRALEAYSALCKKEKIIAEIVRFNCLLCNHRNFSEASYINIFPAKEIVVVDCLKDETQQLEQFSKKSCQYMIKKWRNEFQFNLLDKEKDWKLFLNLYFKSLTRVGAQEKWFFSPGFFERARVSDYFNVYSIWYGDKLASVSMVIEYPFAAYYFLVGNSADFTPGAGEVLIFGITRALAAQNIHHLILGGGNSADPNEPLMRFKRKFAKTTQTFFMAKMIHHPEIYEEFCTLAIKKKPEIEKSNFLMKYRLVDGIL